MISVEERTTSGEYELEDHLLKRKDFVQQSESAQKNEEQIQQKDIDQSYKKVKSILDRKHFKNRFTKLSSKNTASPKSVRQDESYSRTSMNQSVFYGPHH